MNTETQPTAALREFTNITDPVLVNGYPNWRTENEAIDNWVAAVERNPLVKQITPTHQLRVQYRSRGHITVTGAIVVDLELAAQVELEALALLEEPTPTQENEPLEGTVVSHPNTEQDPHHD